MAIKSINGKFRIPVSVYKEVNLYTSEVIENKLHNIRFNLIALWCLFLVYPIWLVGVILNVLNGNLLMTMLSLFGLVIHIIYLSRLVFKEWV